MCDHCWLRTPAGWRAQRVRGVLPEPEVEVEVVVLLRPQHPGEGLAHDHGRSGSSDGGVIEA